MSEEKKANTVIQRLCQHGWEAYIAGGAARDILSGEKPNDYDVVTNAPYDAVEKLFCDRKVALVGVSFKVCIVDGIEVASYRKNTCFNPDDTHCLIEKAESIHEDLACRDLTINAMAFCPYNGDLVDDYGGQRDLKDRIIRFTGNPVDRIDEDPCRILRACRFLAKLEGDFAPETFIQLKKKSHLVKTHVAPERIRLEILKALRYPKPGLFFDALHQIGALGAVSPGFEACYGHAGGAYHGETIDEHIRMVGDFLPAGKALLRLAGYYHDHGKPATAEYKNGRLSFINHAKVGAELVEQEMKHLKFSLKEIAYVRSLILHHLRDIREDDKAKTVRRMLKKLQDSGVDWKDWLQLKIADIRGNLKKEDLEREVIKRIVLKIHYELHPIAGPSAFTIADLAINGRDVMRILKLEPGRQVGQLLIKALDYVLEDPDRNSYDELIRFIKKQE